MARKREVGQIRHDNFDLYTRAPLQDDATSTKSPANRQMTESDDNTRTPDVQFVPTKRNGQYGHKENEGALSRLTDENFNNIANNEIQHAQK